MNSEQMCIDDSRQRPASIRLLEAAITTLVWLSYMGALPLLASLFVPHSAHHPFGALTWDALYAATLGFRAFAVQIFTVVLCGSSLLYAWARYNKLRFRGKDRRTRPVNVTATELARYYGGTPEQIATLQQARRLYMRHDPEGRLTRVHYGVPSDAPHLAHRASRRVRQSSGAVHNVQGVAANFDSISTQELRRAPRKAS